MFVVALTHARRRAVFGSSPQLKAMRERIEVGSAVRELLRYTTVSSATGRIRRGEHVGDDVPAVPNFFCVQIQNRPLRKVRFSMTPKVRAALAQFARRVRSPITNQFSPITCPCPRLRESRTRVLAVESGEPLVSGWSGASVLAGA